MTHSILNSYFLIKLMLSEHIKWLPNVRLYFKHTLTYELKCAYRQGRKGLFHAQERWTTLQLKSPRQWIDLLTKHRDDLELP